MKGYVLVCCLAVLVAVPSAFAQEGTPPAPTDLTAQLAPGTLTHVILNWTAPEGPWLFRVYRSTGDSLNFAAIGYAVSRRYLDHDITGPQTYYYAVTSVDTLLEESPRSAAAWIEISDVPQTPRGIIAGTVKDDATSEALFGVLVRFFRMDSVTHLEFSTVTDSQGHYEAVLDTGNYLIHASKIPMGGTIYEPEWYQDTHSPATALPVNVTENGTNVINFGLVTAAPATMAHIRGVVRDDQGAPLQGASVAVLRTIQEMQRFTARYGIPAGIGSEELDLAGLGHVRGVLWTGVTDALGQYDAEVRDERSYIAVAWKDGYLPEYASEAAEPTTADIIVLTGDTSGVDFTLTPVGTSPASVSGTVQSDGQPVVSRVILFPRPNGTPTVTSRSVSTESDGTYEVSSVEPGTYYVQAVPYSGYSAAYYAEGASGVEAWSAADSVVVLGSVSSVNVSVEPVTSTGVVTVSGTVKTSDGTPIQGASVTAHTTDGTVVGYGITNEEGMYAIDAVAQGEVSFSADRIGVTEGAQTITIPNDTYELASVDFQLDVVVGVPVDETAPAEWALEQNYPNPFNPSTTITYAVASRTLVVLKIHDLLGRELRTLVREEQPAGRYRVVFDAEGLASGTYFLRLQAGEYVQTRTMILLR